MNVKKAVSLSICTIALMLVASCGRGEAKDIRPPMNSQASVQSVLEQKSSQADISATGENSSLQEGDMTAKEPEADTMDAEVDTMGADEDIDVDLTKLSATMVYSEVYNMMYYPENYIGKRVRMEGTYMVYHDEISDKYYHGCIISDATACCSQGIEFELTDDHKYPEDYPEEGALICVTGTFDTYQEGDGTYCVLRDAGM